MTELDALLSVKPDDVMGVLDEFKPNGCSSSDNLNLHFYYVRFQNGFPRIEHFVSKLCDLIVPFCLKREKLRNVTHQQIRQLYLESKRKFAQPKDNKTGEPGELIVFFLLEGCLRAPKIFSKMSLKTNNQMHIHGQTACILAQMDKILFFTLENRNCLAFMQPLSPMR